MAEEFDGRNSTELTDEQRRDLFFIHMGAYKKALAKKKEADAQFKNICKIAKSEGVNPKDIKFAIELEDDGDGALEERRKRQEEIAVWLGLPFGTQADLFEKVGDIEAAEEEGRQAGMQDLEPKPPYSSDPILSQSWLVGYHDGADRRKALLERMNAEEQPEGEAALLRNGKPVEPANDAEFDELPDAAEK